MTKKPIKNLYIYLFFVNEREKQEKSGNLLIQLYPAV